MNHHWQNLHWLMLQQLHLQLLPGRLQLPLMQRLMQHLMQHYLSYDLHLQRAMRQQLSSAYTHTTAVKLLNKQQSGIMLDPSLHLALQSSTTFEAVAGHS